MFTFRCHGNHHFATTHPIKTILSFGNVEWTPCHEDHVSSQDTAGNTTHRARDTSALCASEKVCTQPWVAKTSEKVKPMADSSTRSGMSPWLTSHPPKP